MMLSEPSEHLELSNLCLNQFCLPGFDDQLEADAVRSYIQQGQFVFFEYSIVNWVPHLLASLKHESSDGLTSSCGTDLAEVLEILAIFLDVHWVKPRTRSRTPASVVAAVKSLSPLETGHKEQLVLPQTVASVNSLASSDLKDPLLSET